jgi:hypothetical protein
MNKSNHKSIIAILTFVILFVARAPMAGDYYDAQGDKIVKVLRQEFPIPIDKASFPAVKGAYWKPWSYWKNLHNEHSSKILIYGVKDKMIQDRIIERINALREKRILVRFYDEIRFDGHYDEKGNGGMSRLETPVLRQETLE